MSECGMETLMLTQKIEKQTGFGRGALAVMVFGVMALSLLLANPSPATKK